MEPRSATNVTGGIVAFVLMVLLGGTLWALFNLQVPGTNHDVLLVVIGVLTGSVSTIVNFFFGSSTAARQKDDTIKVQADTANTAAKALASTSSDVLSVPAGQTATVESTDTGTVVKKDQPEK